MTRTDAESVAALASMSGAEAFAMIERHADNYDEAGAMMEAWARARVMVKQKEEHDPR